MIRKTSILTLLVLLFSGVAYAWQPSSYNFEKGDTFIIETETNQTTTLTMMGQETVNAQVMNSTDRLEVLEVNGSEFTLSNNIVSMKLEINSAGTTINVDSEGQTEIDQVLGVLKGKSYQFTISNIGEVLSVTGLEELQQAVSQAIQGTQLAMMASQIVQGFSESSITVQLENQFSIYPDEPTEQWTKSETKEINGLPVTMSSEFLFASDTQLIVSSEITIDGTITQMGQEMQAKMSGTAERTLTLDPDTGISTDLESSQNMEGTITTQGMAIPMKITSESKITATKQ